LSHYPTFFALLANHLWNHSERNDAWLITIGNSTWPERFMQKSDQIARELAALISTNSKFSSELLYETLKGMKRPNKAEEDEVYVLGYVNIMQEVVIQIALDLLVFAKALGQEAEISQQDMESAFSSGYCNPQIWVPAYVARRRRWLSRNALDWLLRKQQNQLASSIEKFPERALQYGALAATAALHGVDDEARHFTNIAAENLVAHGHHKDVLFFGIADSYTKCNTFPPDGGERRYCRRFSTTRKRIFAMTYGQLTPEERYMLAALRRQGLNKSQIALSLGRHRSTVCRELRRNSTRVDGRYRASTAQERANGRRSRPRRNRRFSAEDFALIDRLLRRQWSPEQVAGHLARSGRFAISHETIYRHVWRDKRAGGLLSTHLCGARKRRRKRYGAYDSRGRLAGKRMISERPAEVETRREAGHWESDTVMGSGSKDCIVSLVERKTGLVLIGKLEDRTTASLNRRVIRLIRRDKGVFETVTADNRTEFHDYQGIEARTQVLFYFARPYH
jgi:IS30 family transposase